MLIWTDSPEKEMWRQLRYLRSPANVKNILLGKVQTGRKSPWADTKETQSQAYSIAACIKQAEEYYSAASSVQLSTEPLLQYYGALALAKAIILATIPDLTLEQFAYHGLTVPKGSFSGAVDVRFTQVNNGVFLRLCDAIGDTTPAVGTQLVLKDMMAAMPDLAGLYQRHYSQPSHCIPFYTTDVNDKSDAIFFAVADHADILAVFPEFASGFSRDKVHGKYPGFRTISKVKDPWPFLQNARGMVGGRYVVRVTPGLPRKQMTLLFASLFILSDLVRYRPDMWIKTLEGEETGSGALFEALSNLARRALPNEVLEWIFQERFVYATPGYLE